MEHRLTNEARAGIARKWRDSGQTQAVFAAEYGISDRTLRAWIAKWNPAYRASPRIVQEVVEQAIERLRDVLVGLDSTHDDGDVRPAEGTANSAATPPSAPPLSSVALPIRHAHPTRGVAWDLGNIGAQ
jgi:hypothetical protein